MGLGGGLGVDVPARVGGGLNGPEWVVKGLCRGRL